MARERGALSRRMCPLCDTPQPVTASNKFRTHRDDRTGEVCDASGLLVDGETLAKKVRDRAR